MLQIAHWAPTDARTSDIIFYMDGNEAVFEMAKVLDHLDHFQSWNGVFVY